MKRRHLLLAALSLVLSICMCFCLSACSCGGDPVALATPVVTVDVNGVAKWDAVENASGYAYKISDGEEQTTDKTSVSLTDGQSIVVKAVGDGENYSDSGYSEAKTYSKPAPKPTKLDKPVVTVSDAGVASWTAVGNASGYKYSLDDGANWSDATGTSVTLTDGQKIVVKAIGNGTTYLDSDPSEPKTYTKPAPQPSKLGKPEVTISDTGVASWTADEHADGYKYSTDSGANWSNLITTTSTQLTDGQTVIVKAIGNGTTYLDSDPSDAKTYTAGTTPTPQPSKLGTPTVTISDTGLASWVAVPNATKYMVKIGDSETEQTELSKQLENGQTIQVKAVGDGTNYSTGDYCAVQTYTASTPTPQPTKLGKPEVTLNGAVASWTAIANASGYKYSLDAGATWLDATGTSVTLTNGQTVTVKAVSDSADYVESDPSTPVTYTAGTVDPEPDDALKIETTIEAYAKAQDPVWVKGTKYPQVVLNDKITVSMTGGTNTSKYYDTNHDWRAYESESPVITITAVEGYKIVGAVFTYNAGQNNDLKIDGVLASSDKQHTYASGTLISITPDAQTATFTVSGEKGNIQITKITVFYKRVALPLTAPTVEIDRYGYATWNTIDGASGYKYQIGDEEPVPVAVNAELKSSRLADGATIKVWAVGNEAEYHSDSSKTEQTYHKHTDPLSPPSVNVNSNGLATWDPVPHATGYEYKISGVLASEPLPATTCQVQLQKGQSIEVKTLGDDIYLSSTDFSEVKTYTGDPITLKDPKITIDINGNVSWTLNNDPSDVTSIRYYQGSDLTNIGDSEWKPYTEGNISLDETNGMKIALQLIGNGETVFDSSVVTATYVKAPDALTAPSDVEFTVSEDLGKGKVSVSFTKVEHATDYVYVVVKDGTDGEQKELSKEATKTEVGNKILFTLDLDKEGQKVKIKTVGNEDSYTPATVGDYSGYFRSSADFSEHVFNLPETKANDEAYTVSELLPFFAYYGGTDSPHNFKVTGTVTENAACYTNSNKATVIIEDENNVTLKLYSTQVPAGYEKIAENELAGATVTATGKLSFYTSKSENQLKDSTISSIEMDDNSRFNLAAKALVAMQKELQIEYTENVTLPVTLFGAKITWSLDVSESGCSKEEAETAFNINNANGEVKVKQQTKDIEFKLIATLSVGDKVYPDTDKKLKFAASVPANDGSLKVGTTIEAYATAQNPAWTNDTKYPKINLNDIITVTVSGGGNSGKYYNTNHDWRIYQSGDPTVTFAANAGYQISSLKIIYTVSNGGKLVLKNNTSTEVVSNKAFTNNSSEIALTVVNSGTATNGQVRITEIIVNYIELDNAAKAQSVANGLKEAPTPSESVDNGTKIYTYNFPTSGAFNSTITWALTDTTGWTQNEKTWSKDGDSLNTETGELRIKQTDAKKIISVKATVKVGKDADEATADSQNISVNVPAAGTGSTVSWEKVTKVSDLKAGDVIVLTYIEGATGFAMGSHNSKGYRDKVDFTISNDVPDLTADGIVTITLEATNNATYPFALKCSDGKYLCAVSSGNSCGQSDTITDACKWKFSSTTLPSRLEAADGKNKILSYNTGSPRFSCYGNTGQKALTVYRQATAS